MLVMVTGDEEGHITNLMSEVGVKIDMFAVTLADVF